MSACADAANAKATTSNDRKKPNNLISIPIVVTVADSDEKLYMIWMLFDSDKLYQILRSKRVNMRIAPARKRALFPKRAALAWKGIPILLLALIGSSIPATRLQAQGSAPVSDAEDFSRIYPSAETLFSSRIYGSPDAPNSVILGLTMGYPDDQALFVSLYPRLYTLLVEGKIKLEIKLWGHNVSGLPPYLVAQCMDPVLLPTYLYETFSKEEGDQFASGMDLEDYFVEQALADPRLLPAGLTRDQFHRRLEWCLRFRSEGRIYSEASRFGMIYKWGLRNGGGVFFPVVVVNRKAFEAVNEGDSGDQGFDKQGVLDALKEIGQ